MLKKLALIAIASGLLAEALRQLMQRAEERGYARRQRETKPAVQRWEDEGGLVPETMKPAGS